MSKMIDRLVSWRSRILWFGLGAVFQVALTYAIGVFTIRDPEMVATFSTAISAVGTLGLLAVALWAAAVGVETLKASKAASEAAQKASIEAEKANIQQAAADAQAEIDSKNVNRPYVGASLEPGIQGPFSFDLLIKNYGRSVAKNLTIELVTEVPVMDSVARSLLEMFETPRSLMPTQALRSIWLMTPGPGGKFLADPNDSDVKNGTFRSNWAGMPASAHITVSYTDAGGTKYGETFEVLSDRSGQWPAPSDGPEPEPKMDPTVRKFYRLGQTIARHIGATRY